jgi:hypothetical protein
VSLETTYFGECGQEETPVCGAYPNSRGIFVLDPLRDKRWRELVKKHPASSVFHSAEWLSALHLAYGYEPFVYATCKTSEELQSGMVFCKVKSWLTGHRLVSLPFSDHCDPLVESQADFDGFLSAARKDVDDRKWDYCEFRPVGFAHGLSMAGQSARYYWHVIDLRPTNAAIVRNFHNSVRRKIRRAEREALFYEEGNSERLLGQFYKLLVTTRRRQHLPPQPMKWFRSLIAAFGEKLKIQVAFKGDIPIASILTLDHKNTVTYKYGCSDARFHSLGGVALVLWNTIQRAKAAGCERLDLGRSDICNEGLTAFKEHWGGVRCDLSYWRYPNHSMSHDSLWTRMLVERIVKSVPDPMLIAIGNLLYPHIG